MSELEILDAAIQQLAITGVVKVRVGGQEVESRSLSELLQWRAVLVGAQTSERPGFGLRFQQINPVYR